MTPLVQNVTNILSFGTVVSDLLALALLIIILTPLQEKGWGKKVAEFFGDYAIWIAFLITAGSVVGSLFYSDVAHFAPCELCWIQRFILYPEAFLLLIAVIIRKKVYNNFIRTACIVLSLIQFPISAYHTYIQLGGGDIVPCSATGPSCQFVYFVQYGYVTIPSMALTACVLILLVMLLKKKEV